MDSDGPGTAPLTKDDAIHMLLEATTSSLQSTMDPVILLIRALLLSRSHLSEPSVQGHRRLLPSHEHQRATVAAAASISRAGQCGEWVGFLVVDHNLEGTVGTARTLHSPPLHSPPLPSPPSSPVA